MIYCTESGSAQNLQVDGWSSPESK